MRLKHVLLLLWLIQSNGFAASNKGVDLISGTTISGELAGVENSNLYMSSYSLDAFYSPNSRSKTYGILLGSHLQFSNIEYTVSEVLKRGIHTIWGVYAGLYVTLYKNFEANLNFTLYPYSNLVLVYKSESNVNNETVYHSGLSKLNGDFGQALRGNILGKYKGWPIKWGEIRYGVGLDYFFQQFKEKHDEVFISNSDIGPHHTVENSNIDMELNYLSLRLLVGFSM